MKPECKLIGEDGNVFNLMGIANRMLMKYGMMKEAEDMNKRILDCDSYEAALRIMGEYVDIK